MGPLVQCPSSHRRCATGSQRSAAACVFAQSAAASSLSLIHILGGEGNFVKCVSWYDNEWGYSNRVKDLVKILL